MLAQARKSATPPPATMPSSTAARVACNAFCAYADNGNAACQLSYTLLKLFAIVVAGFALIRFFDLRTNSFNASFDALAFASTVDDDYTPPVKIALSSNIAL
jgi:hypothetical protein